MQQFHLVAVFHDEDQIGPLKNVQIDLTGAVCAHVDAMLQRNLLAELMCRMVDQSPEAGTHHFKFRTQFFLEAVFACRAAANITSAYN